MISKLFVYDGNNYQNTTEGITLLLQALTAEDAAKIFRTERSIRSIRTIDISRIVDAGRCDKIISSIYIHECDRCGRPADQRGLVELGDRTEYCPECAQITHVEECPTCHGLDRRSNMLELRVYGEESQGAIARVCSRCLYRRISTIANVCRCRKCNERYAITYAYRNTHPNYRYDLSLCPKCSEEFEICERCGTVFEKGRLSECNGRRICEACKERMMKQESLKNYGYKPDPIFKTLHGEKNCIGIEFECELKRYDWNASDYAYEVMRGEANNWSYAKTDGSLDNGIEFVTHPISVPAWKEMYSEKFKKEILDVLNEQIKTHPSTAGIHIHFSKNYLGNSRDEQEKQIAKIVYLLSKSDNYEQLRKYCKRTVENIEHWAIPYNISKYNGETSLRNCIGDFTTNNRYKVVNLQNRDTIEFRCFSSIADIEAINAFVALVDNIVEYCKENTEEKVANTDFKEILVYKNNEVINKYMKKYNINLGAKKQCSEYSSVTAQIVSPQSPQITAVHIGGFLPYIPGMTTSTLNELPF